MGSMTPLFGILLSIISPFLNRPPLPPLDLDEWWGPDHLKTRQNTSIRPFEVIFDDYMIADLKFRLSNTRQLTPPLEGTGSEYGFNTNETYRWIWYWMNQYPFQERLLKINRYPQYRTNIQGLDVHFMRVRPEVPQGMEIVPLLMLHGWPSSFLDFQEFIRILTAVDPDRDFAIEVIAASLPGFAFSDGAVRPGFGVDKMAVVLRNLMNRLGHKRFYVHGADWGSVVLSNMATFFPEEVLGYHTSMPVNASPILMFLRLIGALKPSLVVSKPVEDRMYPLKTYLEKIIGEFGYFYIQATKPDTVDTALTDSPAGLLAYYFEKISVGTRFYYRLRADGGLLLHFTPETLIDNLMMYWISNSIGTAGRIYAESFGSRYLSLDIDSIPSPVPTCILQAKYEIAYTPPWMFKYKFHNLLHETILETGGHFLALELPEILAKDVLQAVVRFRQWHCERKHRNCAKG